jgi:thiosulfate dehydrogenase (quinone) large subunit
MTPDEHARLTSSSPPATGSSAAPPPPPPPTGEPVVPGNEPVVPAGPGPATSEPLVPAAEATAAPPTAQPASFTAETPPVGATTTITTTTEVHTDAAVGGHRAGYVLTRFAQFTLFLLRIAIGFVFLWAFLDKLFGLSYSTPTSKAWINGGSPTKGFLSGVNVGPLQSTYHSMAGTWWADWSFMIALALLGVALIFGIALRPAAVGGTILLAMMWLAVYPPAKFDATGTATGSANPFVDDHVLEALIIIVLAATNAGLFFGLSGIWRRMPLIRRAHWLW